MIQMEIYYSEFSEELYEFAKQNGVIIDASDSIDIMLRKNTWAKLSLNGKSKALYLYFYEESIGNIKSRRKVSFLEMVSLIKMANENK